MRGGLRLPGHRQVIDVYVYDRRATDGAVTFLRRAVEAAGGILDEVTTDGVVTCPPALAAVLLYAEHETGEQVQRRIEGEHQHLNGCPMRGLRTLAGARIPGRAHAFLGNLRG